MTVKMTDPCGQWHSLDGSGQGQGRSSQVGIERVVKGGLAGWAEDSTRHHQAEGF